MNKNSERASDKKKEKTAIGEPGANPTAESEMNMLGIQLTKYSAQAKPHNHCEKVEKEWYTMKSSAPWKAVNFLP